MATKKTKTKANVSASSYESDLIYLRDAILFSSEPTRHFEIGQEVTIGNLENAVITDVLCDGKVYGVDYTKVEGSGSDEKRICHNRSARMWYDIFPRIENIDHSIIKNKDCDVTFSNRDIDGLLTIYRSFGVDMSPCYQREFVWSLEDKVALIDSVFHNVDIGKFVFVHRSYASDEPGYEILDGKQRLQALVDFVEDRFTYKGLHYSELSKLEKSFFKRRSVSYAELRDMTEAEKYRTFVLLNTRGRIVNNAQIDKVKDMYKDLTGEELS